MIRERHQAGQYEGDRAREETGDQGAAHELEHSRDAREPELDGSASAGNPNHFCIPC
jgi:hypothetical protein